MINPLESPISTVPKMLRSVLVVSSHSCMLFFARVNFFSMGGRRGLIGEVKDMREWKEGTGKKKGRGGLLKDTAVLARLFRRYKETKEWNISTVGISWRPQ